jgi:hypothetical protein
MSRIEQKGGHIKISEYRDTFLIVEKIRGQCYVFKTFSTKKLSSLTQNKSIRAHKTILTQILPIFCQQNCDFSGKPIS